ncbi:MAG: hypothetical protein LC800_09005, partial [Acidobacteria bacterium]|nr:hypothetical protein [Acidobacteriota bacterium]
MPCTCTCMAGSRMGASCELAGRSSTSRRPADLPVFTAAILKRLGLEIKGKTLLDTNDPSADWWQL